MRIVFSLYETLEGFIMLLDLLCFQDIIVQMLRKSLFLLCHQENTVENYFFCGEEK